jgi:hypothetical protein
MFPWFSGAGLLDDQPSSNPPWRPRCHRCTRLSSVVRSWISSRLAGRSLRSRTTWRSARRRSIPGAAAADRQRPAAGHDQQRPRRAGRGPEADRRPGSGAGDPPQGRGAARRCGAPKRRYEAITVIAAEGRSSSRPGRWGVSESGCYEWRGRAPSARSIRQAWLTSQIMQVHAASRGTYGARRVHAELTLGQGLIVGHGTVELLMRRAGIKGLMVPAGPGPGTRPRPRGTLRTASSAACALTSYGSPTSLSIRPGRERCTARSSWMPGRGGWWAGRLTARRPPPWSPAPWIWPSANRDARQASSYIPITGYTSRVFTDRARASGLVPSMGASATATTMP